MFASGSCIQGVCEAHPGSQLPNFCLPPFSRYAQGTHLRALRVSSSKMPQNLRNWCLPLKNTAPWRAPVRGDREEGTPGRKVVSSAGDPKINHVQVAQVQQSSCWCAKGNSSCRLSSNNSIHSNSEGLLYTH